MQRRTLIEIIHGQIDLYKTIDNPPPPRNSIFSQFADFIKPIYAVKESKGRIRADKYKAETLQKYDSHATNVLKGNDDFIFSKVWDDACQPIKEGPLGSSKLLRIRILRALCEYKKINSREVAAAEAAARKDVDDMMRATHPGFGMQPLLNVDEFIIKALIKLIDPPSDKNLEMQAMRS